jgi:hypothetical protein
MYNRILGAGIVMLATSFKGVSQVPVTNDETNKKLNVNVPDTIITPPANIQASFTSRYPKASNAKWYQYNSTSVPIDWELAGWPTLTNRDYAVMYDLDNVQYYSWYDAQGNWIGSSGYMKDFAGLPLPVTKMLSSKYAGYTIKDLHTENYKDISGYQIELAKGAEKVKLIVDVNGNILKQKTKSVEANGKEIKEKVKIQDK